MGPAAVKDFDATVGKAADIEQKKIFKDEPQCFQ